MKLQITLNGHGGITDRQVIDVNVEDDSAEISEQIHDAIDCWVFAPGDTITITETE